MANNEKEKNYFQSLYDVDVSDKAREKGSLTYLPWSSVWAEVKKRFPNSNYVVYENENGRPWFDDGHTAWVKTGVTINDIEHIEYLPIMNFKNQSIESEKVTSMDANKAIQRSITKACGRHGLGLYVYEGEDIPEAVSKLQVQNETNFKLAQKIAEGGDEKTKLVSEAIRQYEPSGNPRKVEDINVSMQIYDALMAIKRNK